MRAKHVFELLYAWKGVSVAVHPCFTCRCHTAAFLLFFLFCFIFRLSLALVGFTDMLFFQSVVRTFFWCVVFFSFSFLIRASLPPSVVNTPALHLFLQCLSSFFVLPTVVSGSGGEVIPTGWGSFPKGKAESQWLSGRFHHCHYWQEAATVAESDGAASGGELQVQKLTYRVTVDNFNIIDIYVI